MFSPLKFQKSRPNDSRNPKGDVLSMGAINMTGLLHVAILGETYMYIYTAGRNDVV